MHARGTAATVGRLLLVALLGAVLWTGVGLAGSVGGGTADATIPGDDLAQIDGTTVSWNQTTRTFRGSAAPEWASPCSQKQLRTVSLTNTGDQPLDLGSVELQVDGNASVYGFAGPAFDCGDGESKAFPEYVATNRGGGTLAPGESITIVGYGVAYDSHNGMDGHGWTVGDTDFGPLGIGGKTRNTVSPLGHGNEVQLVRKGDRTVLSSHRVIGSTLVLDQDALANVFTTEDTVSIGIDTTASTVEWTLYDYSGSAVASDRVRAGEHGRVDPTFDVGPGHYTLVVDAIEGETLQARERTTIAVVRPRNGVGRDPSFFAMQGHFSFGWDTRLMDLIALSGASHVRDGQTWGVIEPKRGSFTYPDRYRAYMNAAGQQGLEVQTVMAYGNRAYIDDWYGTHTMPHTDAQRTAYGRYLQEVLSNSPYAERIHYTEIWNEPNAELFSKGPEGGGSPERYAALLEATAPMAQSARDDLTVIGGIVAWTPKGGPEYDTGPYEWTESVFEAAPGVTDSIDAWSFHPYRREYEPEEMGRHGRGSLRQEIQDMADLTARYNDGEPLPLWVTEFGYLTTGRRAVTLDRQAQYLVRSHLMAKATDLEKFTWYMFKDGNSGHPGLIHDDGTERQPFTTKPSYVAYSVMTRQLTGTTFAGSDDVAGAYSYRFETDDGSTRRVVWARNETTVDVATDGPVTATTIMGERQTYQPQDGVVTLTLSDDPVYLEGPVASISQSTRLSISAPDRATGETIPVTVELDNTGGDAEQSVTVAFADVPNDGSTSLSAAAGERSSATVQIPAGAEPGRRVLRATVRDGGDAVGALRTRVDVTPDLSPALSATLSDGAEPRRGLTIDIESRTRERDYTVTGVQWSLGEREGGADFGRTIEADGNEQLAVDVAPVALWRDHTAEVRVTFADRRSLTHQATVAYAPVWERSLDVDGRLDEVEGLQGARLPEDGTTQINGHGGAEDLSADVWLTHDAEYLYFAADVTDDVHSSGWPLWKNDGFQLGVAPGRPGERTSFSELAIALSPNGPRVFQGIQPDGASPSQLSDAEVEVRRVEGENRTVYEAAIPWSALNASPDEPTSLAYIVNENDSEARRGWLAWAGGVGSGKDTAKFRQVAYVDPAGSPPAEGSTESGGDSGASETRTPPTASTDGPGLGVLTAVLGALVALLVVHRRR